MSIGGPSALGTLLVHRLDSVLGTTLSQQANVVSGARPDAVRQPGSPERPDATENQTKRHPRDAIDRATARTDQQGRPGVERARLDARMAALLAARNAPDTATTRSAPTVLGHAAKTILALLAKFPDQTAVQGRTPLLTGQASVAAGARVAGSAGTANAGRDAATTPAGRAQQAASTAPGPNAGATAGAAGTGTLGQAGGGIAAQLAQALTHTLQNSGMFYEAHLANLTTGKQSLTQLRQEPQAQAQSGRTATGPTNTAASNAAQAGQAGQPAAAAAPAGTTAAQAGDWQSGNATTTTSTTTSGGQASAAATTSGAPSSGAAAAGNAALPMLGLDPQTHLLVRQQLEVLANQTFAWRGEAWPNAPMDWEIRRREPTPDDTDLPLDTDHWATRITLHLPVLGEVQARITLAGQAVVMQLIAPESASVLGEHADALRSRFSARGLQMSQLNIAQDNFAAAIAAAAAGNDQGAP
jgi:hypothetical protein